MVTLAFCILFVYCFSVGSGPIPMLSSKQPMPRASSPNTRQPFLVWGAPWSQALSAESCEVKGAVIIALVWSSFEATQLPLQSILLQWPQASVSSLSRCSACHRRRRPSLLCSFQLQSVMLQQTYRCEEGAPQAESPHRPQLGLV